MVPEGQLLYIDKKLARMLYYNINNDQDFYRRKIAGHLWRMGKESCSLWTAQENKLGH